MGARGSNVILTTLAVCLVGVAAGEAEPAAQPPRPPASEAALREVLPGAERFTTEAEPYRHYRGYAAVEGGEEKLIGLAVSTRDAGVRYRGYSSTVDVLVGLDARGRITGIRMLEHFEPYGYRSIDRPEYAAQFRGKSVLDPLTVEEDIDGTTGATMTVTAATRSIRSAARRIARDFLARKSGSAP